MSEPADTLGSPPPPSTAVQGTAVTIPPVEVLPEDKGAAFLAANFIGHNSMVVAQVGDVVELSVGTMSGAPLETGLISGVDVVVETAAGQQRVSAERSQSDWSVSFKVGAEGLKYRFEIATDEGVVALPADHGFAQVFAAGTDTLDVGDELPQLGPTNVSTIKVGSGDNQLGRSPVREDGSEGIDSGPAGVAALSGGRLAILDTWNHRIVLLDPDGSISSTVAVDWVGADPTEAPAFGMFAFSEDGIGVFSDGAAVYSIGSKQTVFPLGDFAKTDLLVGDLEIHEATIVARLLSGEYRVVGTLDGTAPDSRFDGLPVAVPLNELLDKGIYVYLPNSKIGHLVAAGTELFPIAGASRFTADGGAVVVMMDGRNGWPLVAVFSPTGEVRVVSLVDETGAPLVLGSAFDQLPDYSVSADGSSLSVFSCDLADCTARTFDLKV